MKTCKISTRAGQFKILLAVKGPRSATPAELKHALAVACNRIMRSERRQTLLRQRRAQKNVVPIRRKKPTRRTGTR